MRAMNIGPHDGVGVHNMSDYLVEQYLLERPDLTFASVDFLKDAPGSGVRQRLSEISQHVRKDDPAAIATIGFGRMNDWGIMTAIKFIPDTEHLIQKVTTHGGGLLVVETPEEIWLRRLTERGLHVPSAHDKVELERPPSENVIQACKEAGVPVWKLDNSRDLVIHHGNTYYREIMRIVQEAEQLSQKLQTVH
ncbi:hypothetical protein BH11PAT4_BH11PAT4_3570 [soil metagenome]